MTDLRPASAAGWLYIGGPLLTVVYAPRPSFGQGWVAWGTLAVIIISLSLIQDGRLRLKPSRELVVLGVLALGYTALIAVSFLVNVRYASLADVSRAVRPLLLLLVGWYGCAVGSQFRGRGATVRHVVVASCWLILVGQAVLVFSQSLGLDLFRPLYYSEKVSGFGGLFRVTGSIGNPNHFAWFVTASATGIVLMDSGFRRFGAVVLSALLILAAGSRTFLLLFPVVLFACLAIRRRMLNRGLGGALAGAGFAAVAGLGSVYIFGDYFPYLNQIVAVFEEGNLTVVGTLTQRFEHWTEAIERFRRGSTLNFLFGVGERQWSAVMDNEYMFTAIRLGIIGLAWELLLLIVAVRATGRRLIIGIGAMAFVGIGSAAAFGLVSETFSGWMLPAWLVFLTGLTLGYSPERTRSTRGSEPA